MAPRKKKSKSESTATAAPAAWSLLVRLAISEFFSCSNAVYWMIGFMTRTRAGPSPRQKALTKHIRSSLIKILMTEPYPSPSLARMLWTVSKNPSFLTTTGWFVAFPNVRTACEVWITQTGLLMMVVAEPACLMWDFVFFFSQQSCSPAISPASIDSKVLRPLPPVLERRIDSLERS